MALVLLPGQFVQGTLLLQLGLEVFDGITACVELGFLRRWVDLDQQLAFLDLIADFDMNLVDLPGSLGTDIDITTGLQGAKRGHAAFYITAADRDGGEAVAPGWQDLPGGEGDDRDQAE